MLKMSPEGKRRKLQEENQEPVSAHNDPVSAHHDPVSAHHDPVSTHKELLSSFLAWCGESGIHLNPKVSIGMEGTVAQYGMLARQDIPAGEVVFTIPRSALLSQHTTRIREMLEEEQQSLDSTSGWVPLILSLMYEATDAGSPWAPYFGLWPRLVPPDLPMFWSEKERAELLEGTGVPDAVSKDLDNIEQEYKTIVLPFILRHPEKFDPQTHTLDLYMRLVAFVMAYSFQEPMEDEDDCEKEVPPPMMVPVADLLNHVARHNTHLEFAADCLRMVTTQSVPAGHELFNTYGQMGNWQLLHMYGFSEPHPDNINDTADIQMTVLREAALQGAESEEQKEKLQERWSFLCHMEMVGEEGAFVFGCEEVLTDEELRTSLKLLCMSAEEFAEYKENDGWEEDEDNDEEEETLTYQKLACMPLSWRKLLHASAELTMKSYTTNLRSDQRILDDPAEYAKLSSRQKYSLQVRYGQKQILQRLMELTAC